MTSSKYILMAIILVAVISCKKNTVEQEIDHSSKYFPLNLNSSHVYQVDSIWFKGSLGEPDTFRYFQKHEVVSSFLDGEQHEAYKIEVSYRFNSNDKWTFQRFYSAKRTNSYASFTDFDKASVVLALPIQLEKIWDIDQFNSDPTTETSFEFVHEPKEVKGNVYDSCTSVYAESALNAIERKYSRYMFAAKEGLIKLEIENTNNQPNGNSTLILGTKFKMEKI